MVAVRCMPLGALGAHQNNYPFFCIRRVCRALAEMAGAESHHPHRRFWTCISLLRVTVLCPQFSGRSAQIGL